MPRKPVLFAIFFALFSNFADASMYPGRAAFISVLGTQKSSSSSIVCHAENLNRRALLKRVAVAPVVSAVLLSSQKVARASGGATAGGAYLLSAKQRYNERVKAGMKTFLGLGASLEAGSLDETKEFFSSEDGGAWKDSSAAGYLLSNAFRTNSSKPPDALPSVQKWKAFAAIVETMQKAVKKKDVAKAFAAYKDALPALDDYLERVELPPAAEL
mmetsp:Transcript_30986/g.71397  ORF Transcript_30986/g.71397 Transcript_30986/m.71397 type:complete len:215 (+) Transcript_30986:993-1637(+)